MRIPTFFAKSLGHQMAGILLPRANRAFIFKICDGDSETVCAADAFGPKTTRLLQSEFEHRLGHRLVAVVSLGAT